MDEPPSSTEDDCPRWGRAISVVGPVAAQVSAAAVPKRSSSNEHTQGRRAWASALCGVVLVPLARPTAAGHLCPGLTQSTATRKCIRWEP